MKDTACASHSILYSRWSRAPGPYAVRLRSPQDGDALLNGRAFDLIATLECDDELHEIQGAGTSREVKRMPFALPGSYSGRLGPAPNLMR